MFQKVNRELLQIKAFYFLYYAGVGALLPFIPIYLKGLGLTATETGVIIGFQPFFSSVCGPIIGGCIDRFKIHKVAFIVFCIITGLGHTSLKFIPPVNRGSTTFLASATLNASNLTCHSSNVVLNLCGSSDTIAMINDSYPVSRNPDLPQLLICNPDNSSIDKLNTSRAHNEMFAQVIFHVQPRSLYDQHNCHYSVFNATFSPTLNASTCQYHSTYKCDFHLENFTKTKVSVYLEFQLPFWMAFSILTIARTIHCAVMMFTDAVAFHYLGEKRSLFGHQRMFGSIGFILVSVPISAVLHFVADDKSKTDFSLAFYTYLGFICLAAFHGLFLKIEFTQRKGNLIAAFIKLLKNKHIATFLCVSTFLGMMIGGLEGFLFWFLKQLGANQMLIGLHVGVALLSEIGTFFLSSHFVRRFGEIHTVQISLAAAAIRLLSYSFVTNPWYSLPVQVLHGPSFHLMLVAAAAYIIGQTPPGMAVTSQAVFGSLVYGVGYGSGNLLTGVAFDYLGGAWTFRLQAMATVGVLILFIIIQCCCLKSPSHSEHNLQDEMEMKTKVAFLGSIRGKTERQMDMT